MEKAVIFFNEKKTNSISAFSQETYINNLYESTVSSFLENQRKPNDLFFAQIQAFENTIFKRMDYLDSLTSLEDDWISGNSKKPTIDVIIKSKEILSEFVQYLKRNIVNSLSFPEIDIDNTFVPSTEIYTINPKIPKIIMGPIPTGGVCLEFHADQSTALFITIKNKERNMDLEVKIKDYYSDIKINTKNYRDLLNEYTALSRI